MSSADARYDSHGVVDGQGGFHGFRTVGDLQDARASRSQNGPWSEVPDVPGVYLVVRDKDAPPVFLTNGTGGHFKGKDPNVDLLVLANAWVRGTNVVYIGKAEKQTLRKRLGQYIDFGLGKPVGHWGGRYIWQLADARDLRVCWRPVVTGPAGEEESRLILAFKRVHGVRPFANLRD